MELQVISEIVAGGVSKIRSLNSERTDLKMQVEKLSLDLSQKNNALARLTEDNTEIKKQVEALISELNSIEFA